MSPLRIVSAAALALLFLLTLAGCFGGDSDRTVKLEALARWEDRRLAPEDSLVALLQDKDAHVRLGAVRTAGLIGRSDVLQPVLDLLSDPSQTVRAQACWSLGILGDTLAVPALEDAAADTRPAIRVAALRGLAHVPNRGHALLVAATGSESAEAAAAFDALRNQADRVPASNLVAAIEAGLGDMAADVRWRALRCAEVVADSSLIDLALPFAGDGNDQIRVHAYRALGRLGGPGYPEVRDAILQTAADHGFRDRAGVRVDVAACRALSGLLDDASDDHMTIAAAYFIEKAGHPHPHVAATALDAMARSVAERPLPAEAAERESLLPVWRIRMARAAAARLDHEDPIVRAGAAKARAALRGRGALEEFTARLESETVAFAAADLARAIGQVSDDPMVELFPLFGRSTFGRPAEDEPRSRWQGDATVVSAALTALADNAATMPEQLRIHLIEFIIRAGSPEANDHDKILAAVAIDLAGRTPDAVLARTAMKIAIQERDPWRPDLVLGTLGTLTSMAAADTASDFDDRTVEMMRRFTGMALDDPDIRIRLAARELAVQADLLETNLIPSEASLRATLPAFVRDQMQPAITLEFETPKVRCTTARGDFIITLKSDIAPNTCAMFLDMTDRGAYDDIIFHRVVPDFVVQGGDPTGTGWGGPGYTIRSEWSPTPYTRGMVGIAHSGKDTGGCQWFVTLSEQPHLVGRYTIFGEVTDGMEVLDLMQPGDAFRLAVEP